MGFFDIFRRSERNVKLGDPDAVKELYECSKQFAVRKLCFNTCVSMIAAAFARCEFRTFSGGQEVRDAEYYLWNVSPNTNENSTAFLHHLISNLCIANEALIVDTGRRSGKEAVVVADSWVGGQKFPDKQNEYTGVTVGDLQYSKTFRENDVMHLTMHHLPLKPVIDALCDSYDSMVDAAERYYIKQHGNRMKVHISRMAQGAEDFQAKFKKMLEEQVKPFYNSTDAVLPEFDGYEWIETKKATETPDSRDLRSLIEDVFDFTARGFLIPAVLINGKVEAVGDATNRFMTYVIDPLCDQFAEEANRKRYGFDRWKNGDYLMVDSSSILHYDLFAEAPNVEKLVGSGVYTINNILRVVGQPELAEKWADEHFLTLNIGAIGTQVQPMTGGEKE